MSFSFKASIINIFTFTADQITMCNLKIVARMYVRNTQGIITHLMLMLRISGFEKTTV